MASLNWKLSLNISCSGIFCVQEEDANNIFLSGYIVLETTPGTFNINHLLQPQRWTVVVGMMIPLSR